MRKAPAFDESRVYTIEEEAQVCRNGVQDCPGPGDEPSCSDCEQEYIEALGDRLDR